MNILFFTVVNKEMSGYMNKIKAQVRALEELGSEVTFTYLGTEGFYIQNMNDVNHVNYESKNHYSQRKQVFKFINNLLKKELGYDVILIRFGYIDPWLLEICKTAQKNNIKVIMEIPTYPYRNELLNNAKKAIKSKKIGGIGVSAIRLLLDFIKPKFLGKYIDLIYTYSEFEKIWGTKVIEIDNGVNLKEIPMKKNRSNGNTIVAIGVGYFQTWHAYERIIKGMANHKKENQNMNFKLILVGDGPDLSMYKNLVKENKLLDCVEFIAPRYGDELNKIFDSADIAISSLGGHTRKNTLPYAPLKTREFCARGIPFVFSYPDKQLTGSEIFALKIPEGDNPINLKEVIDFANLINKNNVNSIIRDYAENYFDWKPQMKKVFTKICEID